MLISKTMNARLNDQIRAELFASHKYLGMACAFEDMGLRILAKRFFQQSEEEREHALKFIRYIVEVGGSVELQAIDKPQKAYRSVEEIVSAALDSEMAVTDMINKLVTLADEEKDYATRSFLQWFVDEQVEEVSSMHDLLALVKLAGSNVLQVEMRVRHDMMEESK
jgi:ferritin